MQTSGPTSGIPSLTTATPVAAVQWRIGQVLQATVADTGVGRALLAIGNRQVSAETSLALQKGDQLTLQVRELGARPVLRLLTATAEPAIAVAVRQLLPRQGALTPLLASIGQIARSPDPPLPPLITRLLRSTADRMPDVQAATTAPGLKQALRNSGVFLERQIDNARREGQPLQLDSDFKANLMRLVQQLRNWPGSAPAPAPASTSGGTPQAPAVAGPPPGGGTAQASDPTRPGAERGAPPAPGQASPSPAQLARVLGAATPGPQAAPAPATQPPGATMVTPAGASAAFAAPAPPPPFAGTPPLPQAAAQASLDLLNRLGNLRTDLLQQAEAALARVQLHQLATLPRDGERGLLEWLFELPLRHGEDIDLWSMRIVRDAREQRQDAAGAVPAWSVQLAFDLPGLGPLHAQVSLTGEQVSTRFWVEAPDTLPLLRGHLHELRQALTDAGLEVGDIDCRPGAPATGAPPPAAPLISEKA